MLKSQPGEAEVYYDYDEANRLEINGMFRTRDERDEGVFVLPSRP